VIDVLLDGHGDSELPRAVRTGFEFVACKMS
jgi:hypothetical protein